MALLRKTSKIVRNTTGTVGIALVLASFAGASAAFADESLGFELEVIPAAVAPGEAVSFTSSDASPGQSVDVHFEYLTWFQPGSNIDYGPDFWGSVVLDPSDPNAGTITIPKAVAPGEYLIYYSCINGDAIYCQGEIPFTVLGDVPTEEPEGVEIRFAADSLQGKPGDPIRVTGDCFYNGVGADAAEASLSYTSMDDLTVSRYFGKFPLESNGILNQELQVPNDAKPPTDEVFSNRLSLECDLGDVVVGESRFAFTVQGDDNTSPISPPPAMPQTPATPQDLASAPQELAATGANEASLFLGAIGLLTLGAGLIMGARSRLRS
ncbi:hypothetical protein G7067_04570 [Leucobacter insecticola]|uniref:Gram-positive cocci surface proteins LPxTG domain-containing protein n=1 Tax=Leucobacter insecticola TaxID=2714934 RepID=A0A6G8FHM0_9MICO|nr:hypothetical protein [Leucobacter insecticola]QIM15851.1 hypothetical protein G7067_04570 [Leucobacter insecticola]